MKKAERLARLQVLFRRPEVTAGFPTKEACLSWCNEVAPLLNFNRQYHQTFLHYLQIISHNVSSYTAEPAFQNMLNQVQMAIGELSRELASDIASPAPAPVAALHQESKSVWKLEPAIYGIGINLPELWKRIKAKFPSKK
jgi:hypothetical protein